MFFAVAISFWGELNNSMNNKLLQILGCLLYLLNNLHVSNSKNLFTLSVSNAPTESDPL